MMAPRKGFRLRRRRKKESENRLQDATKRTKTEARQMAKRKRAESAERRRLAQREKYLARKEEVKVRARGGALEARRRLRPVGKRLQPFAAVAGRFLRWVAPYISQGLLLLVRLPVALVVLLLESTQSALRWIRSTVTRAVAGTARFLKDNVTPLRTYAAVGGLAAVALGVSQFFDYHAVQVDNFFYEGEVGGVAPAPRTNVENAGGAHLYLLVPVALAALCLVWAAYRGNPRLGRWVAALGALGIAVSLIVDLPQGLDTGPSGLAFAGADADLIEGFWAQLSASAVLVLCGLLLASEGREPASSARRRRLRLPRRRRSDVGTVAPRWGAEQ